METLLDFVSVSYGLKPVAVIEKVAKGFLTDNFILSDGAAKYFLKKYRFNVEERITKIHVAKRYFSEGGVPVIMPLHATDGRTYISHNDGFYALFPFVQARDYERATLPDTAVESMATTLAKMHLLGKKSSLAGEQRPKDWNKEAFLEEAGMILEKIQQKPTHDAFDRIALRSILLKKDIVERNQRSFESFGLANDHLLHGDYLYSNIFFNAQDKVSHVYDFEKAGYAPRSYELFRSSTCTFLEGEHIGQHQLNQLCLYIKAYTQVYPMSQDELEAGLEVYYLGAAYGLWVESEHYLHANTRPDALLESYFHRLVFLTNNFERVKIMLTQSLVHV